MKKTRKVLSLLCALAMLISVFGAFTVASAANDVAIVAEVVGDDTTMSADGGTVTYQFKLKGLSKVNSVYFLLPVDLAKFSCTADDVVLGDVLAGGLKNYAERNGQGNAVISWSNATAIDVTENDVLGTIKLTAPTKLTAPASITLTKVEVVYGSDKYNEANANIDIPTVEAGTLDQQLQNTVALTKADEAATTLVAGDKVTVSFNLKGFTKVNSVYVLMPVDLEKFTCTADDVVLGDVLAGGLKNYAERNGQGNAVISWSNATAIDVTDTDVLGTVTMTVKEGVTISDKLTYAPQKIEIVYGADKYNEANANIAIKSVVIDPAAVSGPVDTTEYTITVDTAIENGSITVDAEKAMAGTTVNVTATPKDDTYELDTITVNGKAISGTSFTMPAENVTVSATFKEITIDETPKPLTLKVEKDATESIGSKYTIWTEGEYADKIDIVVNVYNTDGVSMGFVVYDEVTVGEEGKVVFYAPAKCTASVNAVDEISESNENLLGEMLANKVSK